MTQASRNHQSFKNVESNCLTCNSLSCSVMKNCSKECLEDVSAVKKFNYYEKGDRILMEGVEADGVYCISSGKVKIFKSDKDGEQVIIRFAKAGEIIGFNSLTETEKNSVSAKALDETTVCYIDNASFRKIIKDNPEMALGLLQFYSKELNEVENKSLKLARMNVSSKVADALITMFEAYGSKGEESTLNLILSRQEIASLAGTTKEQVSKILSKFRLKGVIKTKGKQINILNFPALKNMARV